MPSLPILVLLFLTLALPALAGDGVLEINQTCATQTGCFAGDTAGLPVTISATGSYRLTSNLVVPNENASGIQVSTDNVSIDLAGFEIRGVVVCSGTPLACTPSVFVGFGSGVVVTSTALSGNSVRNGSIRGMGNYGVQLGVQSEVTNVRVRSNGFNGIDADVGSTVSGNMAYRNGIEGIRASHGATVSGNTAYQNGDDGIEAFSGATVSGNTAYQNGDDGIACSNGCTVSGNTAFLNGGDGLDCGSGCTVVENAAYDNGDANSPTLDDGIECDTGCIVRGNSVRNNSGYGLSLGADSAYSDNVVTANTTGTVTGAGSGNSRGANYCSGIGVGSPFCP